MLLGEQGLVSPQLILNFDAGLKLQAKCYSDGSASAHQVVEISKKQSNSFCWVLVMIIMIRKSKKQRGTQRRVSRGRNVRLRENLLCTSFCGKWFSLSLYNNAVHGCTQSLQSYTVISLLRLHIIFC
ncbi:hypothetical protein NC651_008468 [Populus alba x Populus x berolinensis]|nr:hypothetical protein NC651_008468 [Populus alba x Populus x berolinensis]